MVTHDQDIAVRQRPRYRLAAGLIDDQVGGFGKDRDAPVKERPFVADALQRAIEGGKGDRIGRVGVDHGADIGPHAQDFGMDEDLDMARAFARDLFTLQVDGNEVLRGDFLKAKIMRLHEKMRIVAGQARGDMAENQVALTFARENAPGADQGVLEPVNGRHFILSCCREMIPGGTYTNSGFSAR